MIEQHSTDRPVEVEYVGRHRVEESTFFGGFPQAAMEHTAELEAIAVPVSLAGWVRRNLTRARVSLVLLSVAVVAVVGGLWVVAR